MTDFTMQISAPLHMSSLLRARRAINASFFINGFMVGNWAPKIPVMVERLDVSQGMLGQMVSILGLGALIALIAAAWLVTKFGSAFIIRWSSLLLAFSLILMTLMPTIAMTAISLFWFGMFLGALDNAMNANGVAVEVAIDRPVMSSYHGFWSLGGVFGGLTGGAMIAWFGEMGHAVIVTGIVLLLTLYAWPRLMADENTDPVAGQGVLAGQGKWFPRAAGLYVLGIVALFSFASEGTIINWSALYLQQELEAPLVVSGYAVAAFSLTMALMRFLGDGIRARFGDRRTFIASAVLSAIGLLIGGTASGFYIACTGFFIAGIGMANVVPVLFSAAGKYPGIRPSVGIAVITLLGYGGLLFIPALVGLVAEYYSIGVAFAGWGFIVFVVAALGFILPHIGDKN